jgi:hypothetical protein
MVVKVNKEIYLSATDFLYGVYEQIPIDNTIKTIENACSQILGTDIKVIVRIDMDFIGAINNGLQSIN